MPCAWRAQILRKDVDRAEPCGEHHDAGFIGEGASRTCAWRRLTPRSRSIVTNRKHPEFLCVVCGMSEAAFRRPDGVYLVPITSLRN